MLYPKFASITVAHSFQQVILRARSAVTGGNLTPLPLHCHVIELWRDSSLQLHINLRLAMRR